MNSRATDPNIIIVLASALRMIPGSYPTPEDAAEAIVTRLRFEGYEIKSHAELTGKLGSFY